jgi:hypothetical protein
MSYSLSKKIAYVSGGRNMDKNENEIWELGMIHEK